MYCLLANCSHSVLHKCLLFSHLCTAHLKFCSDLTWRKIGNIIALWHCSLTGYLKLGGSTALLNWMWKLVCCPMEGQLMQQLPELYNDTKYMNRIFEFRFCSYSCRVCCIGDFKVPISVIEEWLLFTIHNLKHPFLKCKIRKNEY